jgi:hypothetical protein
LNLCVFSTSNVPRLSWGMLQNGIRYFGSTPDLYGPEINMKLVNSSSQCLSCVKLGKKERVLCTLNIGAWYKSYVHCMCMRFKKDEEKKDTTRKIVL